MGKVFVFANVQEVPECLCSSNSITDGLTNAFILLAVGSLMWFMELSSGLEQRFFQVTNFVSASQHFKIDIHTFV